MKKLILTGVALSFAAALNATTALADITIATAGPITGSLAALGEQYRRGAEMAVADINAAGGINGEKLVLEIGDDACDPKQAVAVANQMASKGVKFVAGHLCSGSSIPASKVYEEEGILQISPASTNPKFTDEGGWNVARVCGRDDAQGAVAAAFIAKNYAGKKVAVIDDKSAYGKGLADETRKGLEAASFPIALSESFTAGEKDYTALVSKMKDAGVEAVYIGGYHPEEGVIARQMAEQGLKAQIISGDSMNIVEFWTIAGTAGEGLIFTFNPEPRNIPEAKAVVEKFKALDMIQKATRSTPMLRSRNMLRLLRQPRALIARLLLHGCAPAIRLIRFSAPSSWMPRATSRMPSMSGTNSATAPMLKTHRCNKLRLA